MRLDELAARLGCRLDGDGAIDVVGLAGIDEAQPGDLTFLASAKYQSRLAATRASAVIAGEAVSGAPCAVLRARSPYLAWAEAVAVFTATPQLPAVVHPLASVHPTAFLGPDVSVGAFAVVGSRVRIGRRTVLEPHVVVGDDAVIGDDCVLRAHASVRAGAELGARVVVQDGAVIGSDGFGFATRPDGSHQKIPQTGRIVIEDDVEIGAHTAVDRPAVGETRVGRGTKIDNLVQISHGVKIGRHVLLAAQSGIAGSTVVGDGAIMAGQSGAVGHIRIGEGARVGAKSVVTKDLASGQHVAGVPAIDALRWREATVLGRRLPELKRALHALEERLAALEARVK